MTMMYLSVGEQQLRYKQMQTRIKYMLCKVNDNACPLTPTCPLNGTPMTDQRHDVRKVDAARL